MNQSESLQEADGIIQENTAVDFKKEDKGRFYQILIICLILAAVILALYWRVGNYEFINYDDGLYVNENKHVQEGLSIDSIKWAFHLSSRGDKYYWHPLTWVSHIVDYHFFGLNAGAHHLVNVAFHLINTLLLFIALWWMTGSKWRSSFVALLFALHPMNVESVAWIAERKNLLSTFFWILTILLYVYYVKKPDTTKYVLVAISFILGLLSKPMLITLPCVLLLLDLWPLHRIQLSGDTFPENIKSLFARSNLNIVIEKLPLLIIAVAFWLYISHVLQFLGMYVTQSSIPLSLRIENAIVSYLLYIGKMIWPAGLTFFYPFPKAIPIWKVAGSLALIIAVTALALRYMKKYPYLLCGWLWFLGTLVPVLGIVQGGTWPEIADRWAYVPYIGLFTMITWGAADILKGLQKKEAVAGILALAVIVPLAAVSWVQIGYWKNDTILCEHALKLNNSDYVAHVNLGVDYLRKGDIAQSMKHNVQAIMLDPRNRTALFNLANNFAQQKDYKGAIEFYGKLIQADPTYSFTRSLIGMFLVAAGYKEEAFKQLNVALELDPENASAHGSLGMLLANMKKNKEALQHYDTAIRLEPEYAVAYSEKGILLASMGQVNEAVKNLKTAIKLDPKNSTTAYSILGKLLLATGKKDEALKLLTTALSMDPKNAGAHVSLATLLMGMGKEDEATKHLEEAVKIDPNNAAAFNQLGVVWAGKGKYDESAKQFEKALKADPKNVAALCGLATIWAGTGKKDEAIGYFHEALKIDPKNVFANYKLGNVLSSMNRDVEAEKYLREALKLNPDNSDAHKDLGNILFRKGSFDPAIAEYTKALEKSTSTAELYNNIGTAYMNKGNIKKAIEQYEKSVKADPKYALAAKNLNNASKNLKILTEVSEKIKDALFREPMNFNLHMQLADTYQKLGEYDKAIAEYQQAMALQPKSMPAMNGLVAVYSSRQEYDKALGILHKMQEINPGNPEIYYNIACIYAKQDKKNESVSWLEQAIGKGFKNTALIKTDPDLANIRGTSYYMKKFM